MIIIEGTDAVGKTSTINELKKDNIICQDRSKDLISKYMLFEYDTVYRAKKYYEYLKEHECQIIFLVNHNKEELLKRILSRETYDQYDLQAYEYNQLYQETYDYMKDNNMLDGKLFLVDVTNLTLDKQVEKVKKIICQV